MGNIWYYLCDTPPDDNNIETDYVVSKEKRVRFSKIVEIILIDDSIAYGRINE